MNDPRLDVLIENFYQNRECKYYEVNCGTWCQRAWDNCNYRDKPKYVHCEGYIGKCELTHDDFVMARLRTKEEMEKWAKEKK